MVASSHYRAFNLSVHLMPPPALSSFVVAGAHSFGVDKEVNDPPWLVHLAKTHPWHSLLLVEASPLLAAQLETLVRKRTPFHKQSRVIVSNAAICPKRLSGQVLPFYTVAAKLITGDDRLPGFVDQFGTFERARVEKLLPGILRHLEGLRLTSLRDHRPFSGINWTLESLNQTVRAHPVPCRTLGDEVRRHNLPPVSVTLIDIEGLDCEVVAEMDGCDLAPHFLQFEQTWCTKPAVKVATSSVRMRTCGSVTLGYGEEHHPHWSDIAFYRNTSGHPH